MFILITRTYGYVSEWGHITWLHREKRVPRRPIPTISVDSFESFVQGFPEYIELFKKQAIVVFRDFKFSREQQLEVTRLFGDHANWYPNSSTPPEQFWSYEENHLLTMDKLDKHRIQKDELLIPWHLEQMGHGNPAIGATWNMEKFSCDGDKGNTLFANISDVYDLFSEEEALFLKKCKVVEFLNETLEQKEPVLHDAVEMCETSGRYALRLNAILKYKDGRAIFLLHSFDNREPSNEENLRFEKLCWKFTENVHENEELHQFHAWQENDLIVVDLFLMAHAVLGGFKPSERSFYGLWAHRKLGDKYS